MDTIQKDSHRIMVVDDEMMVRELISQWIDEWGYDCFVASSGVEALRMISENSIDVVLADIMMPDMSGIELTQKIKDQYDADVIIMTAFTQDYDYGIAIREGASDFIEKPISMSELNLRLCRVLRERRECVERKEFFEKNRQIIKQLRKTICSVIQAMATTVEIRDPYAAGHQKRVADLARTIAIHLKLPKNKINGLYMAALIHDIGKISVPFEILSKPGKLTNIEYEFFKMHPKTAYRILRDIDFPWPIADIILQHHERLNGSGYPYGLKGDEIMTEAKILGVADMIEAMVTPRIYRSSYLSIEDALNEIQNQKGILYDSDVVDACEYILTENVWQF